MGLFDRRKQHKQELGALMDSVGRDMGLAQQVAAKQVAASGMDMGQLMAAAQQAMQPGVAEAMAAQRDRIMRLNQAGVDTPATLRGVQIDASQPLTFGAQATLDWTVEPPGGATYETRSVDAVHPTAVASLVPGARCIVRVDPDDPHTVMFWGMADGTAPAASVPPAGGGEDRIERLTKLQELRAQGLITDEEFEQRKAAILGGG